MPETATPRKARGFHTHPLLHAIAQAYCAQPIVNVVDSQPLRAEDIRAFHPADA